MGAKKASIAITIEVLREHVDNALESAAASHTHGAGYWANFDRRRNGKLLARERADATTTGRVGKWTLLDDENLYKGIEVMARIAPEAFGRLLSGNVDAPLGDVLVQCIVCGELRYG